MTIWNRRHLLAASLVLALVVLGTVAALALQPAPAVTARDDLAPDDVARVLQLARLHDPRAAIPGIVRQLRLSAHEAELLVNHAAERWRPSHWRLTTEAGQAHLQVSVELPLGRWRPWLNLDLHLQETAALPVVDQARIGWLPLPMPGRWLPSALSSVAQWNGDGPRGVAALAAASVYRVTLRPGQLSVTYAWRPDAPSRMMALLLPAAEHERLREYARTLAEATSGLDPAQTVSLSRLLPPMFETARQRTAAGRDAALENRAALLVLGMAANGIGLSTLLPERAGELDRHPIRLTLAGRADFPQHFLISATIAAEDGASTADTIGLYKELSDARTGTGFSFNDMAANRAGTRFGELAVQAPGRLQQRLIAGVTEQDFMPDVADLPEFMHEPEFRQRFGGPGAPAYERMVADIEQRLTRMALFR